VKKLRSLLLLLSLSLAACGYRWQPDFPDESRPTVSVPFAIGDEEGLFTAEIVNALSRSGLVNVRQTEGEYRLQATILAGGNEPIGFRRDPQKVHGKIRKNLLACEGRRSMTIEALLFKGCEVAYGPYLITVDADYDYVDGDSIQDLTFINPAGELVTVLPFSLGQLESIESAQEAALVPLYAKAAQKIVDAIGATWFNQKYGIPCEDRTVAPDAPMDSFSTSSAG
jgi:hypothetical protein